MTKNKENRENIGKGYVEFQQEQEKERDEMMEKAQEKAIEEKKAERANQEAYKEILDEAEKAESKRADEEMKRAQEEQMKNDYLEEYGFKEKEEEPKEEGGEGGEAEAAKTEAEEQDAAEREKAERELSEAQEKIKKEQLKKELVEELNEPLGKLVRLQNEIKECEEHIKNPKAIIFKAAEIKKYQQEKEALAAKEEIIKEEIEKLAETYEGEGFLSEEEIESIVKEELKEKRKEAGEAIIEQEAGGEETAEKEKKLMRELESIEQEVDAEQEELPKSKKQAFEKLLKNPSFYKVVIGGAIAGASVVCPAFGVGYGAIGIMSAKAAGAAWSIAGVSAAGAVGFKLSDLLKKLRNKK